MQILRSLKKDLIQFSQKRLEGIKMHVLHKGLEYFLLSAVGSDVSYNSFFVCGCGFYIYKL